MDRPEHRERTDQLGVIHRARGHLVAEPVQPADGVLGAQPLVVSVTEVQQPPAVREYVLSQERAAVRRGGSGGGVQTARQFIQQPLEGSHGSP